MVGARQPTHMVPSRIEKEASRLEPLAARVLKRYSLVPVEVTHLATHSNVLFRVVADSGQQMVLRVGTPHANSRSNIELEVAWLDALNHETDLDIVRPIEASDGSLIIDEFDESIESDRQCVLFSWIPGKAMGEGAGPFAYRMLGEMCARLQAHGKGWDPPEGAVVRSWDQVFYYEREFDPVILDDPAYEHVFERPRRWAIAQAQAAAEYVIRRSYDMARPQIVHGDLHEWNVHLSGSRLWAFDFEDVMYALPAQDVSICLYSSRNKDNHDEIRSAFRKGYESIAPWPVIEDAQIDGFHAARQIMLMNYAVRTLPLDEASAYVDHVMPWLEDYLRRYG